ncbi:1135_t:CDS:2, partial [Acaulospora morrowiae]
DSIDHEASSDISSNVHTYSSEPKSSENLKSRVHKITLYQKILNQDRSKFPRRPVPKNLRAQKIELRRLIRKNYGRDFEFQDLGLQDPNIHCANHGSESQIFNSPSLEITPEVSSEDNIIEIFGIAHLEKALLET